MKLRVLHCIHSLSGGGAERQLTLLANHLKGVDLEFGIFCVDSSNHKLEAGACELFSLSDPENYPWHLVKEIRSVIERFKPDLVHCWLPPSVIVPGLIAAKLHHLPTVSSYRNARDFGTWKDVIEYLSEWLMANAIASNNLPEQSNWFFRHLYNQKTHDHIPNAVTVPSQIRKKKADREANGVFTLLFVGRLVDQKNWQVLLKAVASMGNVRPWQLLICGKGEDKKVESLIENLGLNEHVKMLGYRQDVYSVMAESDMLVLPSRHEGMPNVVLEAMSIGLPCIVSRIPAHTELFGDESVVKYFDPSSSEELARTLSDFINGHADVVQLSRNGIEFADKFSPSILVDRYLKFYHKVLGTPGK